MWQKVLLLVKSERKRNNRLYYAEMDVRELPLLALHVCLIHFYSNMRVFWVPKHLFYHKSDIFQ